MTLYTSAAKWDVTSTYLYVLATASSNGTGTKYLVTFDINLTCLSCYAVTSSYDLSASGTVYFLGATGSLVALSCNGGSYAREARFTTDRGATFNTVTAPSNTNAVNGLYASTSSTGIIVLFTGGSNIWYGKRLLPTGAQTSLGTVLSSANSIRSVTTNGPFCGFGYLSTAGTYHLKLYDQNTSTTMTTSSNILQFDSNIPMVTIGDYSYIATKYTLMTVSGNSLMTTELMPLTEKLDNYDNRFDTHGDMTVIFPNGSFMQIVSASSYSSSLPEGYKLIITNPLSGTISEFAISDETLTSVPYSECGYAPYSSTRIILGSRMLSSIRLRLPKFASTIYREFIMI